MYLSQVEFYLLRCLNKKLYIEKEGEKMSVGIETFITFGIYLLFLIGIGVYFYTKTD